MTRPAHRNALLTTCVVACLYHSMTERTLVSRVVDFLDHDIPRGAWSGISVAACASVRPEIGVKPSVLRLVHVPEERLDVRMLRGSTPGPQPPPYRA